MVVKQKDIPEKPVLVFDNSPVCIKMDAGKYFWCACGRTKRHPFCDGSHHHTGIRPVRILLEEEGEVCWCACKHTKEPPFCDGTHKTIPKELKGKLADGSEYEK